VIETKHAGEDDPGGKKLWTIDEYVVVADLYLRRGRSSGIRDPEVLDLAHLTGRSPASISRRLGNFDGTVRTGMGLKPVIGEPLAVFRAMQTDEAFRDHILSEARTRLLLMLHSGRAEQLVDRPHLVDPEAFDVEESAVTPSSLARQMVRAEAKLVARYRRWLDADGTRLRGLVIPTVARLLRADLYDTQLDVLIEAKGESSRENVRYAIGQLLDYRRYLEPRPSLAILLPDQLSADLAPLPNEAGVEVIWQAGDRFTDSAAGRLTRRT
jgi:hypothetical protein